MTTTAPIPLPPREFLDPRGPLPPPAVRRLVDAETALGIVELLRRCGGAPFDDISLHAERVAHALAAAHLPARMGSAGDDDAVVVTPALDGWFREVADRCDRAHRRDAGGVDAAVGGGVDRRSNAAASLRGRKEHGQ